MNGTRSLDSMALQAFMDPSEWYIFNEQVQESAYNFPDITGVLAIGSLIQSFRPPSYFSEPRRTGPLGMAYEAVRNPERRKIFPNNNSDLDIWVAVRDTAESFKAEQPVSLGAVALLEELAAGEVQRGTRQWHNKKFSAFGGFYKQVDLYPRTFRSSNDEDEPWMASRFTNILEQSIMEKLPDFVQRVARFTDKKIPGGFLEVRAFPESTYNLRPDDVPMEDGIKDRQPFPRIADEQWIGPNHASHILYNSDQSTIYPFQQNGRVLGVDIGTYISSKEEVAREHSYGGIILKPDAINRNQVSIIREKIQKGIATFSGKIAVERALQLSPADIREIYPSLSGQDLHDAIEYLTEGKNLGIIVEAPVSEEQMIHELSKIKGLRVGDRNEERLMEGRILDGAIRDLLPLPGDEALYARLLPTLFKRKIDPEHRFTLDEYAYYSRNLAHTPDNIIELRGLLKVVAPELHCD